MKKLLLETSFSKIYMIVMIIITLLILGGYFSYAMFTVSKEKGNAISIVTGNLKYKLTVDDVDSNTLTVESNSSKTFKVTLSNPNNRVARFNFYYIGNIPTNVKMGYILDCEGMATPDAKGVNLEKSVTTASSNIYKIKVDNNTNNSITINLGVKVGLDYNDLSLDENNYLFEKYEVVPTNAVELVKNNANEESLDYNSATGSQQKEAWVHSHEATEQTEALTDYRYIGADPNNYVEFNGELWRIIGVFTIDDGTGNIEERLKIIRNESIGSYSWDNKTRNTGAESNYGKNNWTDARLNYLLNPGHESESVGGSLYWNSGSGTCYSGQNNATTNCDFTTTGLKDDAKNMIGDTLWYLGGASNYTSASNGLASHWYTYERGTNVYNSSTSLRDTSFVGKVGLMYPSDYGYATSGGSTQDRNACLNKELYNWDSSEFSDCKNNDWLYESRYTQWTFSHHSSISYYVFRVGASGYVYNFADTNACNNYTVRPTVFLKSDIKIVDGDGTSCFPYKLEV